MTSAMVSDHMSSQPDSLEMGFVSTDLPMAPVLVTSKDGHVEPCSSIKNFIKDLEHTWGNFEKRVLKLRDGRQIVIPQSLPLTWEHVGFF